MLTNEIIQVPLNKGMFTILNKDDYERIKGMFPTYQYWFAWKGKSGDYYARLRISEMKNGKKYVRVFYIHRLVMNAQKKEEIDHKDNNGLNNLRDNLRVVTHLQNQQNRIQRKRRGLAKGISHDNNKYQAGIRSEGRSYHLGSFNTEQEAMLAYDIAAKILNGNYANLNLPHIQATQEFTQTIQKRIENINALRNTAITTANSSGYRGVVFNKERNTWNASIESKEKEYTLGSSKHKEELAKRYDAAARILHGNNAVLNYPDFNSPSLQKEIKLRLKTIMTGMNPHNTSGFKGVTWWKPTKTWGSQIGHFNTIIRLGYFTNKESAAQAYDEAAKILNEERLHLNFPKQDFPVLRKRVIIRLRKWAIKRGHKYNVPPSFIIKLQTMLDKI